MSAPNIPPPPSGLSTTMITGIIIVAVVALLLMVTLLYVLLRRRRGANAIDKEQAPTMLQVEENISRMNMQLATSPNPRLGRAVSRHNLTPSIVLPVPAPPLPTARPRPSVGSSSPAMDSSGRPMSSAEIVAHHQAAGNMPRPFNPHSDLQFPPAYETLGVRKSTASFSFSRASILPSLRNSIGSSIRSSLYSSSSSRLGQEMLKVRHVFTPLLPDELVLRLNEKLSLIQSFKDGWCIVGRRSPFYAPGLPKPSSYPFGQGVTAEEVEIGAVPSWVFEKRENGVKPERPMRTVSLGVTLVDNGIEGFGGSGEARTDVISWSNF